MHKNVHNQTITFPVGSIAVKSSWIDLTGIPHSERFHRREAWLFDPNSNACSKTVVGLVGLHIAHRTPKKREWIWATFEHVDNVPPAGYLRPSASSKPKTAFTFHDGTSVPMPLKPPACYFFDAAMSTSVPPAPINISRLLPINGDADVTRNTVETNELWRKALRTENSVWQYYQLVMTQWPNADNSPDNDMPATPGFTKPGLPDPHSAFSNATMETWPQRDINKGCMSCHDKRRANDFMWSLEMNSFSVDIVAKREAIDDLKILLREALQ